VANGGRADDYLGRLRSYYIALIILIIFGIIMIILAIGGIINSDLNTVEQFSTVAAIFGGWIAAVIGYFFGEERLDYEHKANKKMLASELNNSKIKVIKNLNEKTKKDTIMAVSRVPFDRIKKVRLDEQIGNAFTSIYKDQFDYIPVVDEKGKLERILSKTDLSNYIMNTVNTLNPDEIKERDLKDLADKWENDKLKEKEPQINAKLNNTIIDIIENEIIPDVKPISIRDNSPVSFALNKMFKEDKNSLPIVDKNNILKGITTKSDFIKYFQEIQNEI
jgi:CBS domain-containing protein